MDAHLLVAFTFISWADSLVLLDSRCLPVVVLDLPQLDREVLQLCCQRPAELGNSVHREGAAWWQLQQACLLGSVVHELITVNKLAAVGVSLSLQGALAG